MKQILLRILLLAAMVALPCVVSAATITVPAGSTQAQIQSIINSAVSGDTVSFSPGIFG